MQKIIKVCEKCNSAYELSYTKTTMRDKDVIHCEICGEELYRWNEAKLWEAKRIAEGNPKGCSENP